MGRTDRGIWEIAAVMDAGAPMPYTEAAHAHPVVRTLHTLICADESHPGPCPYAWSSGYGHAQEAADRAEAEFGEDYDPSGLPTEATLTFYATGEQAADLLERARTALRLTPSGVSGLTGNPVALELRDLSAADPSWESMYDYLVDQHRIEHGTADQHRIEHGTADH
ncbi:hypothetical protein GCM10010329_34310 [Streptomyces spiroverticillatus]|uniref:Uncharacterized protein n=1 Tax=Streptomyces finlayi TaxID=67296 RepID=A0A918WXE9_9ACTN|nr:hypothetical protein [Streptomyces finlayi]GHA08663.1 hypothetical protein GCM10010329_34310 [Streptomyces spiroverticillatus]GHC91568.1 hypothetical protein GCM10010334_26720 [Streptomyces finlayi]